MTINWESGDINSDPHHLRPEQQYPLAASMKPGDVSYLEISELLAGPRNSLWVDSEATVYSEQQAAESIDVSNFCRLIMTSDGMIVDASAGDFVFGPDSSEQIPTDLNRDYATERWIPVIGLVETDEQRKKLENLVFQKYSFLLEQSVLEFVAETDEEA